MEGKIEISIIIAWMVVFSLVMVIIFFTLNYKAKINQVEKEKQLLAFKAAFEAEERQKERIANNLHDEIIPLLTALAQNQQQHKKNLDSKRLIVEDFKSDAEIIDQSIKGIKAIALDLIPTIFINFGLLKAIEHYIRKLNTQNTSAELENKTEFNGEMPFSKAEQINIYRLCLEIMNNLQKHAGYTYLRVIMTTTAKIFTIQFKHDGKAVSDEDIELFSRESAGLGLKSIKSRLLLLQGSVNYTTERTIATINLNLPYKDA
jgi:signal transduction histidine kinase